MILRHAVAALLVAAWGAPAGAQRRVESVVYSSLTPYVRVESEGDVVLPDTATDEARAEPGAFLRVIRVEDDGTSRQLEIVGLPGGGQRREFRVNGALRPYADAGAAFLRETLAAIRSEGRSNSLLEHGTLARLRESGVLPAVLAHVAQQGQPQARLGAYAEILADPSLPPEEFARVLQAARRTEDSATAWPRVIRAALGVAGGLDPRSQALLVTEVMRLPSDTATYTLLRELPHRVTLDDPTVADAFYAGARGAPAGSLASMLPFLMLEDLSLPSTVTAGAIRARAALRDPDRVALLLAVPAACLRSAPVRAAYLEVMRGVTYDIDRLRVQIHLAAAAPPPWRGTPPPCGRG
jgi:hypothetical protein